MKALERERERERMKARERARANEANMERAFENLPWERDEISFILVDAVARVMAPRCISPYTWFRC